ncbi:hypothetical protein WG66_013179 [Moniliophthora roreri]|nr:hypothetical protein WG66_013179 [Moniliophthora roreri]
MMDRQCCENDRTFNAGHDKVASCTSTFSRGLNCNLLYDLGPDNILHELGETSYLIIAVPRSGCRSITLNCECVTIQFERGKEGAKVLSRTN